MFLYVSAGANWKAKINPMTGEMMAVCLSPKYKEFHGTISLWNEMVGSADNNLIKGAKKISYHTENI